MMRGDQGKRKLKEERISKECGFVSFTKTDFSFLLDELQHVSINGTVVSGVRRSPTSQLCTSPVPPEGVSPLP